MPGSSKSGKGKLKRGTSEEHEEQISHATATAVASAVSASASSSAASSLAPVSVAPVPSSPSDGSPSRPPLMPSPSPATPAATTATAVITNTTIVSSRSSSRASSPLPLPLPMDDIAGVSTPAIDATQTQTQDEGDESGMMMMQDTEPIHSKVQSYQPSASQEDENENEAMSDGETPEGTSVENATATATTSASTAASSVPTTAASSTSAAPSSSRAPRNAPSPTQTPIGKSPSPTPMDTAHTQIETARDARELAHATEWSSRLALEPAILRATHPPPPVDLDKVDQVTDRTTFHTMMDTYFRPIEQMDLFKIGQLKTILQHVSTSSTASSSSSTSTTSKDGSQSVGSTASASATTSTSSTVPPMRSSSTDKSSSHTSSSSSSTSSTSAPSSIASSSSTAASSFSTTASASSMHIASSSSTSSASTLSRSTSASYSSSSHSYSNSTSNSSVACTCHLTRTSLHPSSTSSSSSYSSGSTSSYNSSYSQSSSPSSYGATGNYSNTNSTTPSYSAPSSSVAPTAPFPNPLYMAPFLGLSGTTPNALYPPLYNYPTNIFPPPPAPTNSYTATSGTNNNSSGMNTSASGGSAPQPRNNNSYSSSASSSSSSSSSVSPPCPVHGHHSSSTSSSSSSSNRASHGLPPQPRIHSSQFVAIFSQLRNSSNSNSHLPPSVLPPSFITPPSYLDPSFILPPLGRRNVPAVAAPSTPAVNSSPMDITPSTPTLERALSTPMLDTSVHPIAPQPIPQLPGFNEFPHLSLMLGLNVHPDTVCIPHTQALAASSTAASTSTTLPGTSSWAPPKPPIASNSTAAAPRSGTPSGTHSSSSASASSTSSSHSLSLPGHPMLSSTKELSVPVLFTMYSSSTQNSDSGPSSSSSDSVSTSSTTSTSASALTSSSSSSSSSSSVDLSMTAYASVSFSPVSVLVDYSASGLSSSVANLASSLAPSISDQLSKIHPRLQATSFVEVECTDVAGLGYSVEDRQVEKYRRELKEREAAAKEKKAADDKKAPEEKKDMSTPVTSRTSTPIKADPSMKSEPAVKSEFASPMKPRSSDSMPPLEPLASSARSSSIPNSSSTSTAATPSVHPSQLHPTLLQQLIDYVALESNHQAAKRLKEDAVAEKNETMGKLEGMNGIVKIEGVIEEETIDVDSDAHKARSVTRFISNLPHSLIPSSGLTDLAPLPPLPPALASDPVLHELLQLQHYLQLQVDSNRAHAAKLRTRIVMIHQSLYLEKRAQWIKNIHETHASCMLWQSIRLQLKKGVRDVRVPFSILKSLYYKQLKEEPLHHSSADHNSNSSTLPPHPNAWNMKSDSTHSPFLLTSSSSSVTSFGTGKGNKHSSAAALATMHQLVLLPDETRILQLQRSQSAPQIESEWISKTDEQIEAELAAADDPAAVQDNSDEYSVCAICFDKESPEENPILYCDRCNVAAHQRCYGLRRIPDTEGWVWMCDWCTLWKEKLKQIKAKEKAKQKAIHAAISSAVSNSAGTPTPNSGTTTPLPGSIAASSTPVPTSGSNSNLPDLPAMTKKVLTGRPPRSTSQVGPDGFHVPMPIPIGGAGSAAAASSSSSAVSANASSATHSTSANTSILPNPYICALCPSSGGAVKPASDVFDSDGSPLWVHIVCALWIPKVRIMNTTHMSPISVAPALKLQQQYYHRTCAICKLTYGACVPCSHDDCGTYVHPLCAWYDGWAMNVDIIEIDCKFLIYCIKHTPKQLLDGLQMYKPLRHHHPHHTDVNVIVSPEDHLMNAAHLSQHDRALLRQRQQRDLRQRGRAHHSEKIRAKRRKKQYLEKRRRERIRAAREDLYEPGRCAVCFQNDIEMNHAKQMDEIRRKEASAATPKVTTTSTAKEAKEAKESAKEGKESKESKDTKESKESATVVPPPPTHLPPYFLVNGISPNASAKNRLLQCDECEMEVHQNCYGITDAEYDEVQKRVQAERHNIHMNAAGTAHSSSSSSHAHTLDGGSGWVCRRCQQSTSNDKDVSCALCPRKGGAFKKTVTGRWAHVACAVWIPEAGFADPIRLEPIEGLTEMGKVRKKMMCYLCQRTGPCISCCEGGCTNTFHPICGLFSGAYMGILEAAPAPPTAPTTASTSSNATPGSSASDTTSTALVPAAASPSISPPPQVYYRIYCKKHTPFHLTKFVTIPPGYTKLAKLRYAYESCRLGLDHMKTLDKKLLTELKSASDYDDLVWREIRIEAETGVQSKKLKSKKFEAKTTVKPPRIGKKAQAAAAAAQAAQQASAMIAANGTILPGNLTLSSLASPDLSMKGGTLSANSGGLSSPLRQARGRPSKSQSMMNMSSTGGGNTTGMGMNLSNTNSMGNMSPYGGGSSSSSNLTNLHSSSSSTQHHTTNTNSASSQISPSNLNSMNAAAMSQMLSGLQSFNASSFGGLDTSGMVGGNGNSNSNNSYSNAAASLSNSLSNSLGFPFSSLPSSSMSMNLPLSMPMGGSTGGMDLQPLLDMAAHQQTRKPSRGRNKGSHQHSMMGGGKDSLADSQAQNLQLWLQAFENTNTANTLAAAAGMATSSSAYNNNPFNAFNSTAANNALAQYNLSAFYQQLAAVSGLPGFGLGTTGGSSSSSSNAMNNNLTTSLANAFTNSITQSLAASLTNSLNGLNYNQNNLLGLMNVNSMAGANSLLGFPTSFNSLAGMNTTTSTPTNANSSSSSGLVNSNSMNSMNTSAAYNSSSSGSNSNSSNTPINNNNSNSGNSGPSTSSFNTNPSSSQPGVQGSSSSSSSSATVAAAAAASAKRKSDTVVLDDADESASKRTKIDDTTTTSTTNSSTSALIDSSSSHSSIPSSLPSIESIKTTASVAGVKRKVEDEIEGDGSRTKAKHEEKDANNTVQ